MSLGSQDRYTVAMIDPDRPVWQRSDFEFDLPPDLIAREPTAERSASRLLVVRADGSPVQDGWFTQVVSLCRPGDLLIRNITRVLPARLHGQRPTGGRVELVLERIESTYEAWVQIGQSKPVKIGSVITLLNAAVEVEVVSRADAFFKVRFSLDAVTVFERYGEVPLPPYLERAPHAADEIRYQTVYAREKGAVAAPTAGLHFTEEIFNQLTARGVRIAEVTLHVGAGTFKPVKVMNLAEHVMHAEWINVPPATVDAIHETKARGHRVIAVGTTTVRSLEAAARQQPLQPFTGDTRLFIVPGFEFRVVDAMITNFHLSGSTLMMLVSAFAGVDRIRSAYQHAIRERYRFFSYGDAMWLELVGGTGGQA